jgi:two-component system sensor histidine kinase TctE
MPDRTLSLRNRLAGTMALLFLAGTVVLYFAAYAYARTAADRSYDRLLSGSALSIAETLVVSEGTIDVDIPYAALDMLSAAPDDRVFYRVFTADGQTITGYPDLPARVRGSGDRAPDRIRPGTMRPVPLFFDADYRGEIVRFAQLGRQVAEPGRTDSIWVQVGQTRLARQALVWQLVVRAVLPIALLTSLALGIVWFGIGRALRPLETIGLDLTERDPSDLSPVSAPVPVEVAPLVEAINGFMSRLDASIRGLRAFVGEAAHQMRTPLAALRAQAQLAVDDDPEQLRRSLESIERNAARLSRLLNQMLSDATVGHRSTERRFERFDLIDLVREATHEALPLATRDVVEIRTTLDGAPVDGDPLMLAEAVKNLIDNARVHGGGHIVVAIEADEAGYVVSVSDRGPGIAPADHDRVFERFARGAARSPGAGLGLAIVRRAVEGHNGTVTLQDQAGGGLTVLIRLPRSRA